MLDSNYKHTNLNHELFLQWLRQNGALIHPSLTYPTRFSNIQYTGISANQDIQEKTVILGIPKSLIITPSSCIDELGQIFKEQQIFNNNTTQNDPEFNRLTLFLILQKNKAQKSFYYPYFNIAHPQTLLHWTPQQINFLQDNYLRKQLIQVKNQYLSLFNSFKSIVTMNKKYFKYYLMSRQELTEQLFRYCYEFVMTRSFGWGLPETMLIPFGDCLNHNSDSIVHYMVNKELQRKNKYQDYIVKKGYLNMQILGLSEDIQKTQLDKRDSFIRQTLKQKLPLTSLQKKLKIKNYIFKSNSSQTILHSNFYQSSDSEDNDTQQQEGNFSLTNQLKKDQASFFGDPCLSYKYSPLRSSIDRQFTEQRKWDWWRQLGPKGSYFICSTSRATKKGEQIFNSYGKRNNRFTLLNYGFSCFQNKYNSIPFKLWMPQKVPDNSILYADYVSYQQQQQGIKVKGQVVSSELLTGQFRLKQSDICQKLLCYLRVRSISHKKKWMPKFINYPSNFETQIILFKEIKSIIKQLMDIYKVNSILQDLQDLKLQNYKSSREYFGLLHKINNKKIILWQINMVDLVLSVLHQVKQSRNLQSCLGKNYNWQSHKQDMKKLQVDNEQFKLQVRKRCVKYFVNLQICLKYMI